MFYDVVYCQTIEVDSLSVPAEKDSSQHQEISQRFLKVVHALDRLDESAGSEVQAVVIANSQSVYKLTKYVVTAIAYI